MRKDKAEHWVLPGILPLPHKKDIPERKIYTFLWEISEILRGFSLVVPTDKYTYLTMELRRLTTKPTRFDSNATISQLIISRAQ